MNVGAAVARVVDADAAGAWAPEPPHVEVGGRLELDELLSPAQAHLEDELRQLYIEHRQQEWISERGRALLLPCTSRLPSEPRDNSTAASSCRVDGRAAEARECSGTRAQRCTQLCGGGEARAGVAGGDGGAGQAPGRPTHGKSTGPPLLLPPSLSRCRCC